MRDWREADRENFSMRKSTKEVKARGSLHVPGQPDVHIKFQVKLGYTECKTMSQKKKRKERKRETKAWILRHLGIINLAQSWRYSSVVKLYPLYISLQRHQLKGAHNK